jgi:hypothetical protein
VLTSALLCSWRIGSCHERFTAATLPFRVRIDKYELRPDEEQNEVQFEIDANSVM